MKKVPPIDLNELTAQNRSRRNQRLLKLKESVSANCYQVHPEEIAGGMLREAYWEVNCRKL